MSDTFTLSGQSVYLCERCSTRATPVAVPADEREVHDALHAQDATTS